METFFAFTTGLFFGIVLTIAGIVLWNNREKKQLLKNLEVLKKVAKALEDSGKKNNHFPPISGIN